MISSKPIGRPPATNFTSRDPTIDSRGSPQQLGQSSIGVQDHATPDETVAAPSRMFSTNIRYGRSAVSNNVNTRLVGSSVGDHQGVDLAGRDPAVKRVPQLSPSGSAHRIDSSNRGLFHPMN